jgi:hypothetical protein
LAVLLFFFWYCHKRGKETRLEKEKMVDSEGRIVELDDDPMIEASGSATPRETGNESSGRDTEVGRPKRKEVAADNSKVPNRK